MNDDIGNKQAPAGQVYICGACGKVSHWKYGFDLLGNNDASSGWDESCAMNCMLVPVLSIAEPKDWHYPARVRRVAPPSAEEMDTP